jgi:hypothetical protein
VVSTYRLILFTAIVKRMPPKQKGKGSAYAKRTITLEDGMTLNMKREYNPTNQFNIPNRYNTGKQHIKLKPVSTNQIIHDPYQEGAGSKLMAHHHPASNPLPAIRPAAS